MPWLGGAGSSLQQAIRFSPRFQIAGPVKHLPARSEVWRERPHRSRTRSADPGGRKTGAQICLRPGGRNKVGDGPAAIMRYSVDRQADAETAVRINEATVVALGWGIRLESAAHARGKGQEPKQCCTYGINSVANARASANAPGRSGTMIRTMEPAVLFCIKASRASRNFPMYSLEMMRPFD